MKEVVIVSWVFAFIVSVYILVQRKKNQNKDENNNKI